MEQKPAIICRKLHVRGIGTEDSANYVWLFKMSEAVKQRKAVHVCLSGCRGSEDYACTADRRPGDPEHTRAAKPTQVYARAIGTPTLSKDTDGLSAVCARAFETPLPPKDRDGPLDMVGSILHGDPPAPTLHGHTAGPTLQGDTLPAKPNPPHIKSQGEVTVEHHHSSVGWKRSNAAEYAPTAGVQSESPGAGPMEEGPNAWGPVRSPICS